MVKMNGVDVLAQIELLKGIMQIAIIFGAMILSALIGYVWHLNDRIKKLELGS